jgi:hypothetical protein
VGLVLAAAAVLSATQVEMAGVGVWEMGVLAARLAQTEIQGTRVAVAVLVVILEEMVEMELLVVGEVKV